MSHDPCWVHPAKHLTDIVSVALKRQHPTRKKEHDYIIRAEVGLLLVLLDEEGHPLRLLVVSGVVEPVLHARRPRNVRR
jgi:hypothetical protein